MHIVFVRLNDEDYKNIKKTQKYMMLVTQTNWNPSKIFKYLFMIYWLEHTEVYDDLFV